MKSKLIIPVLLSIILFLNGCQIIPTSETHPSSVNSSMQMLVDTPFTQPTSPTENASTVADNAPQTAAFSHSFSMPQAKYEGHELCIPIQCSGEPGTEVGYLLILDGYPQPYKLSEDGEYRYMHSLTIRKAVTTVNFIFDPVTGNNGEQLELCAVNVADPEHLISSDGVSPGKHLSASIPIIAQIDFLAEPVHSVTFPDQQYISKLSSEYAELTAVDISGWTADDLRRRSEYSITVNGTDKLSTFWGVSSSEPVCIHLELWGNPAAEFSVLFYMDGEPLLLTDNTPILTQNEQGKKLVLDVEIDIPDQTETVIYAVVLYRNAYDMYYDGMQWFADGRTYYFATQDKP